MKKTVLLIAPLALMFVACKKDRECSCKQIYSYTIPASGSTPAVSGSTTTDYIKLMKDINLRNAYNACTHTQQFETGATSSWTMDINCELK